MDFSELGKFLILAGAILLAVGVFIFFGTKIPFLGRLPGDIHIIKKNFSFHFPIVTCIVASIILTIVFNIFMKK